MMKKQKSGSIIYIASDLALIAPNNSIYDAEKFKELNEAYQVLGNNQKRQQYDQYGSAYQNYGKKPEVPVTTKEVVKEKPIVVQYENPTPPPPPARCLGSVRRRG